MDLIVLRNVPRRNAESQHRESGREAEQSSNSRLMSMDEVRRRWAKKQAARRGMLSYTPQPA